MPNASARRCFEAVSRESRCEEESGGEGCRNTSAELLRHTVLAVARKEPSIRVRSKLAALGERTKPAQERSCDPRRSMHNRQAGAPGLSFRAHDSPKVSRRECLERSAPVLQANSLRSPPAIITSGCYVTVSCFLNQMCEGLKSHPTVKHFLPSGPLPGASSASVRTQFPPHR